MTQGVNAKIKKNILVLVTALCVFSLSMVVAHADIWGGSRPLSSSNYVEMYADSSVSNNGYSSIYSNAVEEWTGISSKMHGIWAVTSNNSTCDVAYVTDTATNGLLGFNDCRKKILGLVEVSADVNEDWAFCRVYFYDNQMNNANMTVAQKIENFAHEMGHSQKLAHPTTTQTSVMNQGVQSIKITAYDKSQIISKWGK